MSNNHLLFIFMFVEVTRLALFLFDFSNNSDCLTLGISQRSWFDGRCIGSYGTYEERQFFDSWWWTEANVARRNSRKAEYAKSCYAAWCNGSFKGSCIFLHFWDLCNNIFLYIPGAWGIAPRTHFPEYIVDGGILYGNRGGSFMWPSSCVDTCWWYSRSAAIQFNSFNRCNRWLSTHRSHDGHR